MGVALTADNAGVTGVDGPADAVRALNSTRTIVAERRQGRAVTVAFKGGPYSPAARWYTVMASRAAPRRP